MAEKKADWLIVGGGIIGLTLARRLNQKYPDQKIVVLEKEPVLGMHGSGRNSGVLHAGIYYKPGTLRAALCAEGAKWMRDYCAEHDLPILRIGKVIVATDESQAKEIEILNERAYQNGVETKVISTDELKEREPNVNANFPALYSPNTAVVNPKVILKFISDRLIESGVQIDFGVKPTHIDAHLKQVTTQSDTYQYGFLINAAGGHSDRVAKHFDIGTGFRILPFRGKYYRLRKRPGLVINGNIYPVPDARMPFLGVHFTPCPDDNVYVGPTATPALGRENYFGVKGIEMAEGFNVLRFMAGQYIRDDGGVRGLVNAELRRILRRTFQKEASKLVPELQVSDLLISEKRGIRAQLVDMKNKKIVTDFKIECGENSLHILNAPSPAFTSSLRFAEHVVTEHL